jgi:hypothetical protein
MKTLVMSVGVEERGLGGGGELGGGGGEGDIMGTEDQRFRQMTLS